MTVAFPFAEFFFMCLNKYSPVLATEPDNANPNPSKICFFANSITFFGIFLYLFPYINLATYLVKSFPFFDFILGVNTLLIFFSFHYQIFYRSIK